MATFANLSSAGIARPAPMMGAAPGGYTPATQGAAPGGYVAPAPLKTAVTAAKPMLTPAATPKPAATPPAGWVYTGSGWRGPDGKTYAGEQDATPWASAAKSPALPPGVQAGPGPTTIAAGTMMGGVAPGPGATAVERPAAPMQPFEGPSGPSGIPNGPGVIPAPTPSVEDTLAANWRNGGQPQGPVGNQLQQTILGMLGNPSRYGSDQARATFDMLNQRLSQSENEDTQRLREEATRRGIVDGDFYTQGPGGLAGLATRYGQQRADLAGQVAREQATTYGSDAAQAIAQAMGFQQNSQNQAQQAWQNYSGFEQQGFDNQATTQGLQNQLSAQQLQQLLALLGLQGG